jgi:hypothetical protein
LPRQAVVTTRHTGDSATASERRLGTRTGTDAGLRELQLVQDTPEFGRYLQRIAKRDGPVSLRTIAQITGIGKSTINDWFRGLPCPPPHTSTSSPPPSGWTTARWWSCVRQATGSKAKQRRQRTCPNPGRDPQCRSVAPGP